MCVAYVKFNLCCVQKHKLLSGGLLKGGQDFNVHGVFPIMGGAIGSDALLFLFFPPSSFSCSFSAPSPLLSSSPCFSLPLILLLLMNEPLQSLSFYRSESFPLRYKIPVNLMFCSSVEVLVFVLLLIL